MDGVNSGGPETVIPFGSSGKMPKTVTLWDSTGHYRTEPQDS
jgi:hypothetical protein